MNTRSLACCLLSSLLAAQTSKPAVPAAKSFLPDDYRLVAHADLAAMRVRGVWEEFEVSALNLAFQQMRKEAGFPLAHLDRVTIVGDLPPVEEGRRPTSRSVMVLEGNTELALPDYLQQWTQETVGAFQVRRGRARSCVLLDGKVRLEGDTELLAPVLEGHPRAGMPCADVMSLLSGRTDQLAYLVVDVSHPHTKSLLQRLFPSGDWPEGEAPTFLCARVLVLGDADDPHLGLEAVLRHGKAGEGMAKSEAVADAFLAKMRDDPRLRVLKPILAKVEKRRDPIDLVYRADFGRARIAIGHLATLVLPMFAVSSVEEVRPAAPVPAPPKK